MARYFFDTDDGTGLHRDEVGLECNDLDQARWQALKVLPDLAKETILNGNSTVFAVQVREAGRGVFEASLRLEARWL